MSGTRVLTTVNMFRYRVGTKTCTLTCRKPVVILVASGVSELDVDFPCIRWKTVGTITTTTSILLVTVGT